MEISGTYTLYAPRERVWEALLDPAILRQTVPGCERLEREGEDRFRVRVSINVAAVKGVYDGTLRLRDVRRPESYGVAVEGSGARGVLHGEGVVRLEARDATTTVIHYSGQAQLGGTIASVGSRMAQAAGELLLKQYFARLADMLDAPPEPPAHLDQPAQSAETAPVASGAGQATGQAPSARALAGNSPGIPAQPPTQPWRDARADARHVLARDGATGATASARESSGVRRGPLMRFVRRAGLSDGSLESERRIARLLASSIIGVIVLTVVGVVVALSISGRGPFGGR